MTPLQAEADAISLWCAFETLNRVLRVDKPVRVISVSNVTDVVKTLDDVEMACTQEGLGAMGFLSYESSPAFEAAMQVPSKQQCSDFPLLWIALYDPTTSPVPPTEGCIPDTSVPTMPRFTVGPWDPDVSRAEYDEAIQAVRDSIRDGNVYQINYTMRLSCSFSGDASALAGRLVHAQQCGFGAFLDTGRFALASASPELFFHWDRATGQLSTRPMKGTRRRGLSSAADALESAALSASAKDCAENLMIVDLLRNDVGRVAVPGSVAVQDLFRIERYPTVLQMTSTVTARTRPKTSLVDVLRALFPCGSITGAPKMSAMKGIAALEKSTRDVYCGAILHISPGPSGSVTASVPIRTVIVDRSTMRAHYGVGGGVTWDSTPRGEYDEVLAKAAVLHSAVQAELSGAHIPTVLGSGERTHEFSLLETMRLFGEPQEADAGQHEDALLRRFWHLPGHLDRMRASAEYFSFPWPLNSIECALRSCAQEGGRGDKRVRLLLGANGRVQVESTELLACSPPGLAPWATSRLPMDVPAPARPTVVLSGECTHSRNVMLYHKTTDRRVYDNARTRWLIPTEQSAPSTGPPLDVLLWNEDRQVQEFTIGNIVVDMQGQDGTWQLVTPPLACGLLPGVLRSHALLSGHVHERAFGVDDLRSVRSAWLLNSVRGWVPVRFG